MTINFGWASCHSAIAWFTSFFLFFFCSPKVIIVWVVWVLIQVGQPLSTIHTHHPWQIRSIIKLFFDIVNSTVKDSFRTKQILQSCWYCFWKSPTFNFEKIISLKLISFSYFYVNDGYFSRCFFIYGEPTYSISDHSQW